MQETYAFFVKSLTFSRFICALNLQGNPCLQYLTSVSTSASDGATKKNRSVLIIIEML